MNRLQSSTSPHSRRALLAVAAAAAAVVAWTAGANSARPAAPSPTAVAVVDPDRILGKLNELKDRDAALKARGEALQQDVNKLNVELEGIQADLKLSTPGTPAWRDLRAREIELEARGKARVQSLQQILDLERGEVMKAMYEKIVAATAEYAAREGWEIVVLDDRAMINLPGEGTFRDMGGMIRQKKMIYVAPRVDISDPVATYMNNAFVPGN